MHNAKGIMYRLPYTSKYLRGEMFMYHDFDDDNDLDYRIIRRRQYESTKRYYEERGYKVSEYGEVSSKSMPWLQSGFIDEDGEYHSYM